MKYMLQVDRLRRRGVRGGRGSDGGGVHGSWEKSLADAGVRVDSGYLDDYSWPRRCRWTPTASSIITNGPFPRRGNTSAAGHIIDVPDLDAALAWAARTPGARYGRIEVRP